MFHETRAWRVFWSVTGGYLLYIISIARQRDRQRRIHYIDREANVKGYEVVALPDVAVVDKGIADVKTVQGSV